MRCFADAPVPQLSLAHCPDGFVSAVSLCVLLFGTTLIQIALGLSHALVRCFVAPSVLIMSLVYCPDAVVSTVCLCALTFLHGADLSSLNGYWVLVR
jgi:hypothetical protein